MIENKDILRNLFLPDIEKCYEIIRKAKWKDGITCPYCNSKEILKYGSNSKKSQRYKCKSCGKLFNDLTNTIFEHHKFPVNEMMYILANMPHKSTKEISEELDRDYKAVLNFVHEVQKISGKLSPTLEDIIEMDEIYIHAGDKGLKKRILKKEVLTKEGEEQQNQENLQ